MARRAMIATSVARRAPGGDAAFRYPFGGNDIRWGASALMPGPVMASVDEVRIDHSRGGGVFHADGRLIKRRPVLIAAGRYRAQRLVSRRRNTLRKR